MGKEVSNIRFEGVSLIFRNFAGKATKFKPAGFRTATIRIDDLNFAKQLLDDGWNVRYSRPNPDTGVSDSALLEVKISYEGRPPKIVMVTGTGEHRKMTYLDAESVATLDWADITNVDAIIRPYCYDNIGGRSGISAYVKTMYVTVQEDEFADKYDEFCTEYDESPVPFDEN